MFTMIGVAFFALPAVSMRCDFFCLVVFSEFCITWGNCLAPLHSILTLIYLNIGFYLRWKKSQTENCNWASLQFLCDFQRIVLLLHQCVKNQLLVSNSTICICWWTLNAKFYPRNWWRPKIELKRLENICCHVNCNIHIWWPYLCWMCE